MALNNTYFESKGHDVSTPIPEVPGYVPPVVPTPVSPDPGSVPSLPRPTFSGSVNIQFYINNSDDDTLIKNITASGSEKTVVIKDEISLLDFYIPFNDASLAGVNYASMLGRYYYCHPVLNKGNITGIQFRVDALMSHAATIKGLSAIIDRTGNNYNTYLPDSQVKITAYNNVHTIEATSGFSQNLNYYLLTVGDKGEVVPE